MRRAVLLVLGLSAIASCDRLRKRPPPQQIEDPPPPPSSAPTRTPQTFDPTPVTAFADAASIDGKPPLEQARIYEANGQLWLARLVLEPKALGADGTREEAEVLGSICARQGDAACVDRCGKKAGHKISADAGALAARPVETGAEHVEPDNDAARARAMFLKGDLAGAHKLLEPKVVDGKATKEEIRLLKTVCEKEGDQKMCVALCARSLK